jgi:hypothetical protein
MEAWIISHFVIPDVSGVGLVPEVLNFEFGVYNLVMGTYRGEVVLMVVYNIPRTVSDEEVEDICCVRVIGRYVGRGFDELVKVVIIDTVEKFETQFAFFMVRLPNLASVV